MTSDQTSPRVTIPGSERPPLAGGKPAGPADPEERIEISLYLRPRTGTRVASAAGRTRPLSRQRLAALRGAAPADIAAVQDFAHQHGLDVVSIDPARRHVKLAGTVAALTAAFGTQLDRVRLADQVVRARSGPLTVPAPLGGIITGVLGLDNRPQAKPHFRVAGGAAGAAAPVAFTALDVAALYDFPAGDGGGECIAIVELGGGFKTADLAAYFTGLHLATPRVTAIAVDHGQNKPAGVNSADGEVMLDLEVAGAVAPAATLAVYFAPNTSQGFTDAVSTAIHDDVNHPSVVSISWGGPEESWTKQAIQALDDALQDAAALGVTVLVASGDDGSADGETDKKLHVDFPASSPHALACGGTRLIAGGTGAHRTLAQETVWNDGATGGAGGGGISRAFPLPTYQARAHVPPAADDHHTGRGLPDLAGNADPDSGFKVRVDGHNLVIGGTSAVAPLYAGLVARLNQSLTAAGAARAGFLNPLLYTAAMAPAGYHDVTTGNNNVSGVAGHAYQAATGWDPATGWGSLNGTALLKALTAAAPASKTAKPKATQAGAGAAKPNLAGPRAAR